MNNDTQAQTELVSITEAAALLGVSLDTMRRWDESGKLRPVPRVAGAMRTYRRTDVEALVAGSDGAA